MKNFFNHEIIFPIHFFKHYQHLSTPPLFVPVRFTCTPPLNVNFFCKLNMKDINAFYTVMYTMPIQIFTCS